MHHPGRCLNEDIFPRERAQARDKFMHLSESSFGLGGSRVIPKYNFECHESEGMSLFSKFTEYWGPQLEKGTELHQLHQEKFIIEYETKQLGG
jgi:hypothetical protein